MSVKVKPILTVIAALISVLFSISISAYERDTLNIGSRFGLEDFKSRFNPRISGSVYQKQILDDIFEALLARDEFGNPVPGVAESWDISEDRLRYVFNIRGNARWNDGQPIIANDFILAIPNVTDNIFTIKALNSHQIEIKVNSTSAPVLELFSYYKRTPIPAHIHEKSGGDWVIPENLTSNGAYNFDFKNSKENEKIAMVKNKLYWNQENVAIDNVNYLTFKKQGNYSRLLLKNELDVVIEAPVFQLEVLKKKIPAYVRLFPQKTACYLLVNSKREGLNNNKLRKVIAQAIDRKKLIESTGRPELEVVDTIAPNIFGYESIRRFEYDSLKAKQLLDEIKSELPKLEYGLLSASTVSSKRLASYMRGALKKTGLTIKPEFQQNWQTVLDKLAVGDFDMCTYCWGPDKVKISDFFGLIITGQPDNHGRYSNSEVDQLWQQARSTDDQLERFALLQQAEKIAVDEIAVIPLLRGKVISLVHPDLEGWETGLDNNHPIRLLKWKE